MPENSKTYKGIYAMHKYWGKNHLTRFQNLLQNIVKPVTLLWILFAVPVLLLLKH